MQHTKNSHDLCIFIHIQCLGWRPLHGSAISWMAVSLCSCSYRSYVTGYTNEYTEDFIAEMIYYLNILLLSIVSLAASWARAWFNNAIWRNEMTSVHRLTACRVRVSCRTVWNVNWILFNNQKNTVPAYIGRSIGVSAAQVDTENWSVAILLFIALPIKTFLAVPREWTVWQETRCLITLEFVSSVFTYSR